MAGPVLPGSTHFGVFGKNEVTAGAVWSKRSELSFTLKPDGI
jgi:hypothetical protein